jgi:hypothetical protein
MIATRRSRNTITTITDPPIMIALLRPELSAHGLVAGNQYMVSLSTPSARRLVTIARQIRNTGLILPRVEKSEDFMVLNI